MTKRFSFANLLGGGARSRAATEDEDKPETEGVDEDEAQADEDTAAEAEDGAAKDEDPDEDEAQSEGDEASRRAARRGAMAERRRIAGILALASPDTVAQAAVFATQTDMTVDQARRALAAAPKTSGGLAAAMRGRAAAPVAPSAGGPTAGSLPPELQAAQARRVSKDR